MRDEEAGGGGCEENLLERTSTKNMCFLIKLYFRRKQNLNLCGIQTLVE